MYAIPVIIMKRLIGLLVLACSTVLVLAGPGHGGDEGNNTGNHDTGGLEFSLKPKGFGQTGQFQFGVEGPAVNYFTQFLSSCISTN